MKNIVLVIIILVAAVSVKLQAQVTVISNKSVNETVNQTMLTNIYTMVYSKWSSGSKVVVIDNNESSVHGKFYSFIGKDPASVRKEWLKKQLTGEGKAPESLNSDEEVINKVASTPGAIGFVKSSSVNKSVKVLLEIN